MINGIRICCDKSIVLGYQDTYFVKDQSDVHKTIQKSMPFLMGELHFDRIYVEFSRHFFQQAFQWRLAAIVYLPTYFS